MRLNINAFHLMVPIQDAVSVQVTVQVGCAIITIFYDLVCYCHILYERLRNNDVNILAYSFHNLVYFRS